VNNYPTYAFTKNIDYGVIARFLSFAWIMFVCVLTQQMLQEKQTRIKEVMFIMGFKQRLFWIGWATVAVCSGLLVCAVMTIGGKMVFWSQASIVWIVAVVIGMMLACITFSFLCYTVMSKASSGTLFAAAWIVVWTMLSDTIAGQITVDNMVFFGWNFVFLPTPSPSSSFSFYDLLCYYF